jgi:membrane-associated phospholipid phosphatase
MSDEKRDWGRAKAFLMWSIYTPTSALARAIKQVALVYAVWLFCTIAALIKSGKLLAFEESLLLGLHEYAAPALDHMAKTVSASVTVVSVGVLLYLCCRRHWKSAFFWLSSVGGAAILNNVVKRMMERDRPALWDAVVSRHNFGFPSGHATHSMAILIAALILFGPAKLRMPVVLGGISYAFLVALCRMYLGLHYPTDVLAGWALSLAWICAFSLLYEFLSGWRKVDTGAVDISLEWTEKNAA